MLAAHSDGDDGQTAVLGCHLDGPQDVVTQPRASPTNPQTKALGGFIPRPPDPEQEFGASSLETQLSKCLGGQHLQGGGQGAANPWAGRGQTTNRKENRHHGDGRLPPPTGQVQTARQRSTQRGKLASRPSHGAGRASGHAAWCGRALTCRCWSWHSTHPKDPLGPAARKSAP